MAREENLNFQQELRTAIINTSPKEIKIIRRNIEKFDNIIKKKQEETGLEYDKIIEKMYFDLFTQLNDYKETLPTESVQKQLYAAKMIEANPFLIERFYNKIKDKTFDINKDSKKLQGNEEKCVEFEIRLALELIRKSEEKEVDEAFIERAKYNVQLRNYNIKEIVLKIYKTTYENFLDNCEYGEIFLQKTEEEKIKKYISFRRKKYEKMYKDALIEKLKISGDFFKEYDILNELLNLQNLDYVRIGMPNMQCNLKKQDEKDMGLEEVFTEQYLETLNIQQLSILNAFWQNKYTKMLNDLKMALFAIKTIDISSKRVDNNCNIEITDEELKNILYKIYICDKVSKKFDDSNRVVYDVPENFKKQYKNYFDVLLPNSKNDFIDDYAFGHLQRNTIKDVYKTKTDMLNNLLLTIEYDRNITNWGYIKDLNSDKKITKEKFILIGIDYPGFNMPLKIHMKREELINYLKSIRDDKNAIIPVYGGDPYLQYKGKMLTSKVLMPLTANAESEIIQQNKQMNCDNKKTSNIIKQLGNLVTKNVKKIKKITPSEYIDLETGLIGKKVDGKIVPDDETIRE